MKYQLTLFLFSFLYIHQSPALDVYQPNQKEPFIGFFQKKEQKNEKDFKLVLHEMPKKESSIVFDKTLTGYGYLKKKDGKIPIQMQEIDYEATGFTVFAKENDWVQLALNSSKKRLAWAQIKKGDRFIPLNKLFKDKLLYPTKEWDMQLYYSPSLKSPQVKKLKKGVIEMGAELLQQKEVKGKIWIKLRLVQGQCEGEIKPLAEGWLPLRNKASQLNLWFWSRGC